MKTHFQWFCPHTLKRYPRLPQTPTKKEVHSEIVGEGSGGPSSRGPRSGDILDTCRPRHHAVVSRGPCHSTYRAHWFVAFFRVPMFNGCFWKGGIGSIFYPPEGKDYKWYISGIYCQYWGIICHLPPFRGTRSNHWTCHSISNDRQVCAHLLMDNRLWYISICDIGFTYISCGWPPPRMPVENEGLGWDPLLKIWYSWWSLLLWGGHTQYISCD